MGSEHLVLHIIYREYVADSRALWRFGLTNREPMPIRPRLAKLFVLLELHSMS